MNLEELIYEYGHVMYMMGRYETDGKDTGKEYNKLLKRKEELKQKFDDHFNSSSKKMAKSLGLI
jgi:hypothetical protein